MFLPEVSGYAHVEQMGRPLETVHVWYAFVLLLRIRGQATVLQINLDMHQAVKR